MRRPESAVARAAVALGRALRDEGLRASVDHELVFCRGLAELDPRRRADVYWAARAAFVRARDEFPAFDRVFARFWAGQPLLAAEVVAEHGETDPRMPGPQHGGESLPQFRQDARAATLADGGATRATREIPSSPGDDRGRGERRGALAAYSPAESVAEPEALAYGPEELSAVRRLAEELRHCVPERRSRRLRSSRSGGRLDLRRTLRRSLETGGEPFRPAYAAPSLTPRRLLFLCDVSGSMERYSRVLLASLKGVVAAEPKAEAFVFATRLTRLTRPLGCRDAERALESARAAVADWSGGTRIGEVLSRFNRTWGRRGLARGALVVVVSDGWDRGDPDLLAREVQRLQLQARRLVWINPRPLTLDRQPLAIGMRAALSYVDDYVPGHDPQATAGIARVVSGVGGGRPRRRLAAPLRDHR